MSEIDKFIEKSKWPCGKLICVEPEYIGKFGCHGCRLNFTETRPFRQHCTQCEIGQQNLELIAEVERLKEIIKETFVNNLHIFCPSCKEKDCLCMLDSTCEKLRNILDGKK